ncbi:MAG: TIGR03936 family radical SAM-associated protein [Candidatus Omnitrophota bacterium]
MKIRLFFSKFNNLKYISHLDLMRLFLRVLRRSGLPLKFSEGFNPHPKFSIKRAFKLGVEFFNEEASFELKDSIAIDHVNRAILTQLPEGIEINKLEYA